ncbi:MAG: haloalkane dehalogenase [Myxococcales bacterium]|nr:haloalkane dehalogenase [Myxococcales bacterium]
MEVLRTPDSRFEGLPGYPYPPKYLALAGHDELRMHYVDEGPTKARPVLMLHGEPSWSYLYRHMIPIIAEAGYRAIAPDLIGFGRSDKPASLDDYTYAAHEAWLEAFITGLDLRRIILVCQDWGGLLGLRLVARFPERFDAVVAANTFLPSGREPVSEAFLAWQKLSQSIPEFDVGRVIQGGTKTELSKQVMAAYDAPFPDESYRMAARKFPLLVPTTGDSPGALENQKHWGALAKFDKPFLTAFSDGDPITRGADKFLQVAIPGAKGISHTTVKGGGHFLQEDRGPEFAKVILEFANSHK